MRDYENEYPDDNKLDIAFIAEDSREVRSVSISGSQAESISAISKINSIHLCNSPFLNFDQEIGNMSQWGIDEINIFQKKMRKRKSSAIAEQIQESNQDERQIQKMSKCTKKRIGQKMKVITVGGSPINQINNNSYSLRSKKNSKAEQRQERNISPQDSSDQIRQIVDQINGKTTVRTKDKGNNMNYNFLNNRL